jgi:hypothetical protein
MKYMKALSLVSLQGDYVLHLDTYLHDDNAKENQRYKYNYAFVSGDWNFEDLATHQRA